ncbi:helix-turn-helix domain-containing protein [Emticicia agri]|nr:helix-turn-helix domain-containing protein [Emticicia agri]
MKSIILNGIEVNEFLNSLRDIMREEIAKTNANPQSINELISIQDTAKFLGMAKQTIYQLVSEREIPHYKRSGKLYFKVEELTKWVEDGKRKTINEIYQADNTSMKSNKKK